MAKPGKSILYNADILTCAADKPQAQAILLQGNRILLTGSNSEILALSDVQTSQFDCQGKTLIPGFIDAHCHFFSGLRKLFSLDLSPATVKSITDIQDILRRKVRYVPRDTWISGTDYNEFYLAEKRHPTRADLDMAAPDHPVMITHRSLHACVLNSLALQKVGINNETEEPQGGIIDRDLDSGAPNGILYEMLPFIQQRIHSPLSKEEYSWGVSELNRQYLSAGITSYTDATVTNDLSQLQVFKELKQKNLIHSRVDVMLGEAGLSDYLSAGLKPPTLTGRDPVAVQGETLFVNTGSLKIVISRATGQILPQQDDLNRMVLAAAQAGFQVAIHAVEEDSVEASIIALENANKLLSKNNLRHRIEHCSECSPQLIQRLRNAGAVIVSQPPFLYYHTDRYLRELDLTTQSYLYPFHSWLDAGIIVGGSSDSPVVPNSPIVGMYGAVSRSSEAGEIVTPDEKITRQQALALYTSQAAYAGFAEHEKGTLSPGKLADVVMLSNNPLTCPVEELKNLHIEKTIIGGQVVYEKEQS
jgi:predicted amidohydrolase YtcJ